MAKVVPFFEETVGSGQGLLLAGKFWLLTGEPLWDIYNFPLKTLYKEEIPVTHQQNKDHKSFSLECI